MNRGLQIAFFILGISLFSCVSQKKSIYFSKSDNYNVDSIPLTKKQYKVQAQDALFISITSFNSQLSEFYNLKEGNEKGYIVSDSGYIYMPVLDSVEVKGKTVTEIQVALQQLIRTHVVDATVIVKLANLYITILGEVGKPGPVAFDGSEMTIIEAIGKAGDIVEFGNKEEVLLIRKEGNYKKFITLDFTKRDLIASEYFYLQPGDVLYVKPLKAKNFRLNVSQIALLLTFSSLTIFFINTLRK